MGAPIGPHRQFPSGAAYAEALQHTQLCFRHPELRAAKPELTNLGLPRAISGAFASVFSLTSVVSGQRYAVKCFTRYIPDQAVRYQAISSQLGRLDPGGLSQPWKLGFEYIPDAIRVGSDLFPVLKMDWVEAVTLSTWLDNHHADSQAVDRLATRFVELATDLTAHGIAHGDLQHGNLLVAADGTFRLVDYDGMYVPALAGHGGTERGHRNYQSPARDNDDFGADLDRFSTWVIFLALKAVASDPALWNRLHEPSGEFLLLTEEDFKSPSTSTNLLTLLSHPNHTVSGLADHVRSLSYQPLDALPSLAPVVPAQAGATSAADSTVRSASARSAATGALPGWMSDHLTTSTAAAPPAGITGSAGFRGRRAADVTAAVLLSLALAACVLLTLAHALIPLGTGLVPVVFAGLVSLFARRRRPEPKASRTALADLRSRLRQLDEPEKAAAKLRKERARLDTSEANRKVGLPRERQKLTDRSNQERKSVEETKAKTLREIDRKIMGLDSDLQTALAKALSAHQAAFVRDYMSHRLIAQSKPHGIGVTLTERLAAAGIRTAADFTGYRVIQNSPYNSTGAQLVLRGGGRVNVHGIGEAKAKALDSWRLAVRDSAVRAQPTRLSTAEQRSIRHDFTLRHAALADQRKVAERIAENEHAQVRQRLEAGQARLAREDAAANAHAQQKRQEFSRRAVLLQQNASRYEALRGSLDEAQRLSHGLTYGRYLRFLYTGR
ncbi:hypothetical protein [Streptomyces goshikiensis]|uniref:hypothetical protein n=1 Tax=Streptomyces goshikiensis TaxID=1942 RepID=UPI003657DA85